MSVRVNQPAPEFTTDAVVAGEIKKVSLSDFRGKYVVLFFYPLDFTFVCPTEIIAFSDAAKEFEKRNCQLLGASVDSVFTHLAFIQLPRAQGGLGELHYPLLSDLNKSLSRAYGVLVPDESYSMRGLFIIDRQGVVQSALINNDPLGRSVDETVRLLDALQHFETHGEVCPANWKPGSATIKPDIHGKKEYFSQLHA